MDRSTTQVPPAATPLFEAGFWIRAGLIGAFTALSAPFLILNDGLAPGDGLALVVLGGALAAIAWLRTHALLGDGRTPAQQAPRPAQA